MITEPLVNDVNNKTIKTNFLTIEIDVWINKLTKRKHIMAYCYPPETYVGDDLWMGFKFSYDDLKDEKEFIDRLLSKYRYWIALGKK